MNRPWMPFYVADYRADTAHLNAAQHGAYVLLILHYWQCGSLPDDDAQLARVACMTPIEWRKAKPIVQAFFVDGWRHKRIDTEIAKAEAKHERRVESGKRGGIAKANGKQNPSNATSNASGIALASSSQPQSEREEEPADAGPSSVTPYAFESGVIRLTQEHFDNWAKSFSNLNLRAELLAKTEWAGSLPRGRWFHALPNVLAKLDREVAIKKAKENNGSGFKTMSGIDGVI